MSNNNYIQEYFTNSTDPNKTGYWKPQYFENSEAWEEFEEIISKISDDERVLDVGCGYHPFKGKIKNLLGIDKFNTEADIVVDLMDFDAVPESYDVVIALGSTNLFGFELIEQQIEKVVSWCKPGGRIFMRVNPQIDKVTSPKECAYSWTTDDIEYFTKKHNLTIIKPVELNKNLRYIFTWQK